MPAPDEYVARNIADLRKRRGYTVRSLSERLGKIGRPLQPSGITKVEQQKRAVSVSDLIAFAIALDVNPDRLLLPVDMKADIELTATVRVSAADAWAWCDGTAPLDLDVDDREREEVVADFLLGVRPPGHKPAFSIDAIQLGMSRILAAVDRVRADAERVQGALGHDVVEQVEGAPDGER